MSKSKPSLSPDDSLTLQPGAITGFAWAMLTAFVVLSLLVLAAMPQSIWEQLLLAAALVLTMIALRPVALRHLYVSNLGLILRFVLLTLGLFVSTRYLLWRAFYTLPTEGVVDFALGLLLYAGEVFAFVILILGMFVSLRPITRPVAPLPADRSQWPSVDVLIPSYNESTELLETTLLGARDIDYPADKLKVYLLDDGGTIEKRSQADPERRQTAEARHQELNALCEQLGVQYLTRERNHSAKAGNLNDALPKVHGELVLILDADHVPTRDFLRNTVGWFLRNPKLFLVQTPHFFLSPDPIEKNLAIFQRMPSEQEMFYTNIQRGLDFWNASFFCGSAAVLRRSCLDEVGGLAGETITEDAETALELHRRGYDSAYIWRPMIAGLQPETFSSLVTQRARWAQGMMQLFLLKNPLRSGGRVHWWQQLGYLNSMMFWWFPFARLIFLFAPLAYLFFGLGIFNANFNELLAYMIPHLIGVLIVIDYLYGNARWSFVSEFYETALSFFLIKPLITVIRQPRAPHFAVTAKGEVSGQDFISPLARPIYWLIGLSLAGMLAGLIRVALVPGSLVTDLVTLFWNSLNLLLLIGALGALLERQQRRAAPRFDIDAEAHIKCGDDWLPCRTWDLSATGIGLVVDAQVGERIAELSRVRVLVQRAAADFVEVHVDIRDRQPFGDDLRLGCLFVGKDGALSTAEKATIVRLVFGDSERWRTILQARDQRVGILPASRIMLQLVVQYGLAHLRFLGRNLARQWQDRWQNHRHGERYAPGQSEQHLRSGSAASPDAHKPPPSQPPVTAALSLAQSE
ncbi:MULTISPECIES: UDP-forming cellulose synthase catalytic subunit [Thiorhodovibrio]|uniref:UDP-forming cellulose synthase catalytic subunit n=1 Tax=Thiorhodovibrio TaxID=61593 RepID=UPI0019145728|nr:MULTISPECIES: UDP-forming cellulose synthase catalytic subunit [Thiorhodovibrio]MBK5970807.1 cellulose synthase catalytic subunit (UDP-forming) [Thiorhodovibrio winogradskyi]WPL10802.1 Cellulose synthase catalytic subunit [UDP-forming] [Thiorhodovibrio litoralis]